MSCTRRIGDCVGGHISLTWYDAGETCQAHRHPGAQISLLLSGGYLEESSAGKTAAKAGLLTGKPAGFEHEDIFGNLGALILSVKLDEAPFLNEFFASDRTSGVRDILMATAATGDLESLARSISGVSLPATGDGERPLWLDHAHETLRVSGESRSHGVAQTAGIHPVTFARRFRSVFGRTPSAVRQSGRTARALQAIIRSGDSLADVAVDAGFADQAHLTRTIRQSTGHPPARLRRIFAAG